MKVRTRALLVLVLIAALLASAPGGAGAQTVDDRNRPDDGVSLFTPEERVGEWTAQRASYGLSQLGPDALLKLQESKQGQSSLDIWGIPLSIDEEAELLRREEVLDQIPSIRFDSESFAGVELDISQKVAVLEVFSTRKLTKDETRLIERSAPSSTATRYTQVKYSFA